jgi:hypothetical protein
MEQEKTEKPEDTDYDQNPIYLPWQQSVTKRISRHWRAKRGKSGQLDKNPTTVLLPMGEVKQKTVYVE